mmetsp:Transcript_65957/g.187356  ORF Transcript_65957/g.187356 Transcript_65957/m.187356 type:complete len:293 (-) Transcript_65957:51-929(-)
MRQLCHTPWSTQTVQARRCRSCHRGKWSLHAFARSLRALTWLLVRRPERQVVAQELHDERGILVGFLGDVVELRDGVLKSRPGHLAGVVRVLEHLVEEDGVVQRKAEANGMRHHQVLLSHLRRLFVRQPCILGSFGLLLTIPEFSDVPVVVGFHLLVENLGLPVCRLADEVAVKQAQDCVANLLQFSLNLLAVLLGVLCLLLVPLCLLLLLDASDDPPRSTPAAHCVFVGHGKKVPFLNRELVWELPDCFHVGGHLVIALGLLRKLRKIYLLIAGHAAAGCWGIPDGHGRNT